MSLPTIVGFDTSARTVTLQFDEDIVPRGFTIGAKFAHEFDADRPTAEEYEKVCTANHALEKEVAQLRHELAASRERERAALAAWNEERERGWRAEVDAAKEAKP